MNIRLSLILLALLSVNGKAACSEPELPVIVRNDSLSVSLFSELADQQTGNIAFSPSSLAEVLHLLEQGAAGETLARLREHPMGSLHVRHAIKPLSANALFVDEDVKLKRDFPQVLRVPFASAPAEAAADINDWCDEHTKGTIPGLISEGSLPSSTRMVAVNALYLKERWLHPFPEGQTQPHPFTRADGSKVTASMMQADATLAVAEGRDWQAVALPYAAQRDGEPTCMVAILPRGSARDFAARLTPQKWESIRAALAAAQTEITRVSLPDFELRTPSFSLRPALERAGLSDIFASRANWTGFSDEPLELADIVQRCYIRIDEEGTEAAAVSAGVIVESASAPEEPKRELRFDRPFLWVITDLHSSAAPYFMGLVQDPTGPQAERP